MDKTKLPGPVAHRQLQVVTVVNGSNVTTAVPVPTATSLPTPTAVPSDGSWSGSRGSSNNVITLAPVTTPNPFDVRCDASFYGQWATHNLTCAGSPLDVSAAVAAASCSVYRGGAVSLRDVCVSICTFPSCDNGTWNYHATAGAFSPVYTGVDVAGFFPPAVQTSLKNVSVATVCPVATNSNTTAAFSACGCPAPWTPSSVAPTTPTPAPAVNPLANWLPSNAEAAVAPLAKTTAAATIAIGTVVSISGGIMSSASAATTAAASSSMMLLTFDMLQFGSMINQIPLSEKGKVLTSMGEQTKFAVFNYLGFLFPEEANTTTSRRLTTANCQGVCEYAVTIGVPENRLFIVTLLGVIAAGVVVLALYGIAFAFVSFVMRRPELTSKWFDYTIGILVIVGMASQYALGVTGVYQLYLGYRDRVYDASFFLAIFSLLFLAVGLLAFGYYIIQKHERDLLDVAKIEHTKKAVNMRYGALYDEYTFENRFFFAPKMLLALLCGMTTGAAFMNATLQVVLILVFHIAFLVHLEQCQPFQTRFLQHSMALITLVKIITLILSMFLISSIEGLPQAFHDVVSNIIVALQMLVLAALMMRQVVLLYQRWRAEKAHDEQMAAMESALKPLDSLETLAALRRPSDAALHPIKNEAIVRL
ncbi:hypothetical protein ACHHYP_05308 [Achlya hypogyna]|uniref:TRP C-terminal domain-containing protein n=1 Tax=Achlya hypogyna TaxID=1202772 RepID=A0A1V9YY05_ACHHY|nr:hypothetical protein ACHHYP_05308 [Achlya hypogyna]